MGLLLYHIEKQLIMNIDLRNYSIMFIKGVFFQQVCQSQVSLPKVFRDNIDLQSQLKIPVWGNSNRKAGINSK